MKLNISKIKELIQDSYLKDYFVGQLELILVVDYNYNHIDQLEKLIDVMESGLSNYHKEFHRAQEYLTIQASIIAQNTMSNHYVIKGEERLPDVHSLYEVFAGKKSKIKNFKDEYYKNRF